MGDGNPKQAKLSWSKKMIRKWFNIKSKCEDFEADDAVYQGDQVENRRTSFSEGDSSAFKKSKTEKFSCKTEKVRRRRMNLEHPRIIDVQNYSIFVATWNLAGRSPSSNLDLDNLVHSSPPADIYVIGFQEIVPLNAGNILGAEDNGPARKWLNLIQKSLNNLPGTNGVTKCYTPSPISTPIVEQYADFDGSSRQNSTHFPRRSFQASSSWRMDNDCSSTPQPRLNRRFSISDHLIFGQGLRSSHYSRPSDYSRPSESSRPSDCEPNFRWGHRPSDYSRPSNYSRPSDYCRSSASSRPSDYEPNFSRAHQSSDYSRPSNYSRHGDYCRSSESSRPSDYSKWGSSDDDYRFVMDSPSTVLFSPLNHRDGYKRHSDYCLAASKQMVGIFLTIWVKSDLKDHVRNIKVSCVGRGLMGYLGNKGSVSVSMSLHQTSFCFVCSHLTSGEKESDELRRNSDVMDILKKTSFPRAHGSSTENCPETILEHDRIIWLGDLNYRISLSYRNAKALVEMRNWSALLESDQLLRDQKHGKVFVGWNEGKIYFPPTYKYSTNSDQYAGDGICLKEKRRTPSWCDRILWFGGGLYQVSYVRGESKFSDHRPVYGVFWAEVESNRGRLKKSMSYSSSRIESDEFLPYSHYTELNFF